MPFKSILNAPIVNVIYDKCSIRYDYRFATLAKVLDFLIDLIGPG